MVVNDGLQQAGISILAHRLVTVATHTDGHDVVGAFHPLYALTEEAVEVFLVALIIPCSPLLTIAGILLMIAGHGLMVGCSDDYSHSVSSLQVLWVVSIESPVPHSRPKEITLKAENEFKDLCIEAVVAIVCAEGVLHPRRETGSLVIEEDTTITHIRLAIGIFARPYIYILMSYHRHISPIVPRRHTHLTGELIDAEDCSPLVASCNHELTVYCFDDVFLRPALQITKNALLNPLVNLLIRAYGTYQNTIASISSLTRHALKVLFQAGDSQLHTTMFAIVERYASLTYRYGIGRWLERHELLCCEDTDTQQKGDYEEGNTFHIALVFVFKKRQPLSSRSDWRRKRLLII